MVAGDGTTSVVVICGSLLKKAQELLDKGVHPTVISDSFNKAAQKACEVRNAARARCMGRCKRASHWAGYEGVGIMRGTCCYWILSWCCDAWALRMRAVHGRWILLMFCKLGVMVRVVADRAVVVRTAGWWWVGAGLMEWWVGGRIQGMGGVGSDCYGRGWVGVERGPRVECQGAGGVGADTGGWR